MAQEALNKVWRLEVHDPQKSAEWKLLWNFDEIHRDTYQQLAYNLSEINAPILFRITPDSD